MKKVEINDSKVKRLTIEVNEEMFESLANEIARDNNIDIEIAKIILAMDEMEMYDWIYISTSRLIFYIGNEYADVYNIRNGWVDIYENGVKTDSFTFRKYIQWSAYRNELY